MAVFMDCVSQLTNDLLFEVYLSKKKWNALGGAVILFSLQNFIAPALDYCPACKPKVLF